MKAPAFQFYADDFVGGTVDLSAEDVGCYIRLLCYQWGRGEIPAAKAACDRVAGCAVSPEVMAKFPDRKNPRMERERVKQVEYREAQSKNGANGARKRWHGDAIATLSPDHSTAIVSPMASGMARNGSPSPSPSPDSASASDAARREGNRKLPESLSTVPFRASWEKWCIYSADKNNGRPLPFATVDSHLETLRKLGPIDGVAAIENAIARNLREPAMSNGGGKFKPERPQAAVRYV